MNQFETDDPREIIQRSYEGFATLMLKKISDILIVSNPYDAFILEEDRSLSEQLTADYFDLSLSAAPRVVHVSSGQAAIDALREHSFGLVITMSRIGDMDPFSLGQSLKAIQADLPVVLLGYDTQEVEFFLETRRVRPGIDKVFVWTGDSGILMSIVKHIEDELNVAHDTRHGMVRVILLVEDMPRYYSKFLSMVYNQVMVQTRDLIFDSLSEREKKLRRRARPKVLLAHTFEEAEALYNEHRLHILAVISDVRYPRNGKEDPEAGFRLVEMVKEDDAHTPCLIQSSESGNKDRAQQIGARFIFKDGDLYEQFLESFVRSDMGFGDFVFRLPNGSEIARAGNIQQMRHSLVMAPDESIAFHASRDHFSTWFIARSEFGLASLIKPRKVVDFPDITALRNHLVSAVNACIQERRHGVITNYADNGFVMDNVFVRYGEGSIGGKARGVGFIDHLLSRNSFYRRWPNVTLRIPRTFVLATDVYDHFLEQNGILHRAMEEDNDLKVAEMFMQASLPRKVLDTLLEYLRYYSFPLAVRSSSLLEDAYYQPLAGIYSTFMLPNCHPDIRQRFKQLHTAIKLVYASVFMQNSKAYHSSTTDRLKEEKMAVVIQEMAGREYEGHFYPAVSGVAQSYNFYPLGHMRPDDGIVMAALGLGKMVVDGGKVMRFCPAFPEIHPYSHAPAEFTRHSQADFYALCLQEQPQLQGEERGNLVTLSLQDAERHGTLFPTGGVYVPADGVIRDSLQFEGVRIVNFANLIKYDLFPFREILLELLELCREGMGSPVEMEFAVNIDNKRKNEVEFFPLQIRPLVTHRQELEISFEGVDVETIFVSTNRALGNGRIPDVYDLVVVRPEIFDPARTRSIAVEVGVMNEKLRAEGRRYVLIGPGRWGSSDSWLGIPVNWKQISKAAVIVETKLDNMDVDPSQGTHFFHNIVSLGIGYLTVMTGRFNEFVNWDLIDRHKPIEETAYLRHYRLENPMDIRLDGRSGQAMLIDTDVGDLRKE